MMPNTRHVAVGAAAAFVAFVVWVLGGWSHGLVLTTTDDIVFIVLAIIAAIFVAMAARSTQGRQRAAWLCMLVGVVGWGAGDVIWTYYELALNTAPFPSPADAAYLLMPVGACLALLLFPKDYSGQSRGRIFLDGVIVAASLLLVSWVTVLGPVYEAGAPDRLSFFVSLAYPVSDLVILTVAAVVLVRAGSEQRLSLTLLTLGLVCIAVSDSAFVYLSATNQYNSGNAIDIGWAAGLLLITVAAAAGNEKVQEEEARTGLPGWASIWLPYAPLLLAAIVAAANPPTVMRSRLVEAVGILLVVAVLVRQFLAVSENRLLLTTVAEQALQDPLTGLANRALFNDRLEHAMEPHRRADSSVAVMALDLNDFKLVNDTLGHAAGDELLKGVAQRILGSVRGDDTVARVGGDEFAVLVQGEADHAYLIAHRVLQAFAEPFSIDGQEVLMRPSVGLALAEPDEPDLTPDELQRRADAAMYSGKRSRVGGVHTYSAEMVVGNEIDKDFLRGGAPLSATSDGAAMVKLLGELRLAIDRLDLALVYQPKFDLRTQEIVGVEALLRWPHPERGILGPEEFLALVRGYGLMGPVNDFVVKRALDDAVVWHAASVDVPVAVNLFAPSLADLKLPGQIAQALADRGLSSAALTVEITEHLLLDNVERTKAVLQQLRQNGIRVAIDDFGSGYSALSYLRDLPIDEVKLDRNFVAPILVDERAAAVVQAVVNLAHVLGLTIVVEGVENAETAARLGEYGCDVGQGYFYSPPLSADELLDLLKRRATSASEPASTKSS